MTSDEIRQRFLDFFKSKNHEIVASAPIVVKNDPTLLFTNAGMNQFKDYFLGNLVAPFSRVADTQKCLRVSGKHNDLEEVGVDTYHHTMFEMLGNWSFGDYFKKEAIAWSWELLTEVFDLDKSRLYITIFEGDGKENLQRDDEAYNEWKRWISEDRILPGNKKDNFWEMGDTGPCGPCTEIHYDSRADEERKTEDGKKLVNADHPEVIEIWNIVFIQFNRLKNRELELLPSRHVDTGMGFERLVRVLQNKQSNYDTDVFTGTIAETEKLTGKKYTNDDSKPAVAFRVIADHIRAIAFTIADGQLPSNTGAGYVIRRILRRAVRYYYSYLDYKQPLLYELLPEIAKQFEDVFPELEQQEAFIGKVIKEEEEGFLRTLENGLQILNQNINYLSRIQNFLNKEKGKSWYDKQIADVDTYANKKVNSVVMNLADYIANEISQPLNGFNEFSLIKQIENKPDYNDAFQTLYNYVLFLPAKTTFLLHDTYGFPFDLTRLIVNESNFYTDESEFNFYLNQQKKRSRASTSIDTGDWIVLENEATNKFIGYNSLEAKTKVSRYRKIKAKGKEAFQLVLEETPFYAESGGQVGDTGILLFENETIHITDTKKENNVIVQFAEKLPENIEAPVFAKVDKEKRSANAVHHSATHLLHAALRKVLGTHVSQKGSLVNEEHLRFDFSHFAKVTDVELKEIERLINEKIRENITVEIKEMPKDEAIALGAMALFGEKYNDTVRVVMMDKDYSIELCGGTHVKATGELGFFKITHETAVAAGVRRIEAVAGKAAEKLLQQKFELLENIQEILKNPKDVIKSLDNIITENSDLKKRIEHLEARQLVGIRNDLLQKDEIINQVNFIGDIVEVSHADALKKLCLDLKNHLRDYVVVLCANIGGKPYVAVSIAENVSAARNLDASKIIKEQVAPLIKGGGGGQKTLATAGGQDAGNLQQVIEKVKSLL